MHIRVQGGRVRKDTPCTPNSPDYGAEESRPGFISETDDDARAGQAVLVLLTRV